MKRLILLFLLVPTLLFSYEYVIPYGDTPFPVDSSSALSVTTDDGDRVVAIDNFTYLIQRGDCWSAENCFTDLTAGTTVDIVIDAEDMTKKFISAPTAWKTSNDYVTITLGVCTSYTGGTLVTVVNRNSEYSSKAREVTMHYDATITGGVFPTYDTILVGTTSTNQNSGGGTSQGNYPILLDNDTIYVFRIKIPEGDNIEVLESSIIWFEVAQ